VRVKLTISKKKIMISNSLSIRFLLLILLTLQLTACSWLWGGKGYEKDGPPHFKVDVSKIPDAVPKVEPLSRYGNPASYMIKGHRFYVSKTCAGYHERGIASWYGTKFHGHLTSNREPYSLLAMTGASRTLPLPTYVRVVNLQNHKHIIVKVNDRGPFNLNRIIDLSYVGAKKLGYAEKGTALVEVTAIDPRKWCKEDENRIAATQVAEIKHASPQLYLQVGAFAFENNAKNLKNRILNLSELMSRTSVRITQTTRNGCTLYRVQLGPLTDVTQSDRLYQLLDAQGLQPITAVN